MERSPIITLLFHIRILALSVLLMLFDAYFVYNAYQYTLNKGASVQIVFGFEVGLFLV
jgi:E3 ubiquitin-protein ligase synoviolin